MFGFGKERPAVVRNEAPKAAAAETPVVAETPATQEALESHEKMLRSPFGRFIQEYVKKNINRGPNDAANVVFNGEVFVVENLPSDTPSETAATLSRFLNNMSLMHDGMKEAAIKNTETRPLADPDLQDRVLVAMETTNVVRPKRADEEDAWQEAA